MPVQMRTLSMRTCPQAQLEPIRFQRKSSCTCVVSLDLLPGRKECLILLILLFLFLFAKHNWHVGTEVSSHQARDRGTLEYE